MYAEQNISRQKKNMFSCENITSFIILYLSVFERIICQLFSSVLEVLKDCYFKPIRLSKELV